jgi:hypothetical protein
LKKLPVSEVAKYHTGNMWAQTWGNIADILTPYPQKPSINVTGEMVAYVIFSSFYYLPLYFFYRNMVKGQLNKPLVTSPSPLISCIKHERSFMSDVSTESITKFLTLSHDHLPIQF